MVLGSLFLEGENHEFWVALGCLSDHNALKQHAFIRGLQLDVSLAVAWAHLGKVLSNLYFNLLGCIWAILLTKCNPSMENCYHCVL